ncbi:MAG: hypothetical protein AAF682_11140 [Planctomycetota bacterium]
MNQKTKTLVAGALAAAGGAVWVPQLLSAGSPPAHHVIEEFPADEGAGAPRVTIPSAPKVGAPQQAPESPSPAGELDASPQEAGSGPAGALADLERTLSQAEQLSGDTGALDLASLLGALDPDRDAAAAADEEPAPLPAGPPAGEVLLAFAAEHALTGTIAGEQEAVAMLGHRVVRRGDRLGQAGIEVADIGPGWVDLSRDGERLRVELQPFEARGGVARTPQGDGDDPDTASGGEVDSAPEPAGQQLEGGGQ